jgi:hypothetical protein
MAQVAIDYSRILFDATGKPYWARMDGSKVYLPPLVAAQSQDPRAKQWAQGMGVAVDPGGQVTANDSAPGGSYFRERGHWDSGEGEWDQNTNWENIIGTSLAAIPIAAGSAAVLGGGGGGSAASQAGAGGTLPSSTIPNAHLAVPTTAGMGSQGASAGLGMLGLNGAGSAIANGAASGGGGVLGKLKSLFTNPEGLAGLGGIIGALASGGAGGGAGSGTGGADLEELKRINQITEARMRRVDPLHQAVTQLAWGRLPTNSRSGVTAPVPSPLPEPR